MLTLVVAFVVYHAGVAVLAAVLSKPKPGTGFLSVPK